MFSRNNLCKKQSELRQQCLCNHKATTVKAALVAIVILYGIKDRDNKVFTTTIKVASAAIDCDSLQYQESRHDYCDSDL
ncbi:hypothetical protein MTR_6g012387 [Medicago truncatula]|uniref:Uncharacterized protein n=1 Tax=Medicago truncatula TaxID=3880 RepID=A0A072UGT8_MEDTR|nr:hypothetical protein MTR_6g012387 [Medicago truncatula]